MSYITVNTYKISPGWFESILESHLKGRFRIPVSAIIFDTFVNIHLPYAMYRIIISNYSLGCYTINIHKYNNGWEMVEVNNFNDFIQLLFTVMYVKTC